MGSLFNGMLDSQPSLCGIFGGLYGIVMWKHAYNKEVS